MPEEAWDNERSPLPRRWAAIWLLLALQRPVLLLLRVPVVPRAVAQLGQAAGNTPRACNCV